MFDPGLDRHEWESELAALEDDIRTDPGEALSGLDGLVARMLEEVGYALDDPVARDGDEREVVSDYLAAHEITESYERGSPEISPGDVAAAIGALRELVDYVLSTRSHVDADITPSGETEP
jgi:hypothetical protein